MLNAKFQKAAQFQPLLAAIDTYWNEIQQQELAFGLENIFQELGVKPDQLGIFEMTITDFLEVFSEITQRRYARKFGKIAARNTLLDNMQSLIKQRGINPDEVTVMFTNGEFVAKAQYFIDPFNFLFDYIEANPQAFDSQKEYYHQQIEHYGLENIMQLTSTEQILKRVLPR